MLSRLGRRLNDIKLRDKMLLSYVLFMLIPLLVVGLVVVQDLRKDSRNEARHLAADSVSRLQIRTLDALKVAMRVADRLSVDGQLGALVTTRYPGVLELFRAYHEFSTFGLYRDLSPEISGIKLYVDNPTLIDNWELRPVTPSETGAFWYKAAAAHPHGNGWFSWADPTRRPESTLSLVRRIPLNAPPSSATLVIDIDTSRLESLLRQETFETLILDQNNAVVASNIGAPPHLQPAGVPLADPRLLALAAWGPAGTYDRSYAGKDSWVFIDDLQPEESFNGLKIACIVSVDAVMGPSDRVSFMGLAVLFGSSVFSLAFLWVIYTLFARRLERLTGRLPLVAAGDFRQNLPEDGTDEIGQLSSRFDAMVGDIRALMDQVRVSQEQKSELELKQNEIRLKMLASQINPHFLFNVLESIRMKAHLRGQGEIAQTVKMLGRLMRRNLEAGKGLIPLSEELESVRCYLEIERFRLEDNLRFTVRATDEAQKVLIPPLIVEPLVENAVVHGLEGRFGGGQVRVEADIVGAQLRIVVTDDGQGMEAARLAAVTDSLADLEGHHIGIKNIHQRLLLTFGPNAGLALESRPDQGTTVRLNIPLAVPVLVEAP